MSTLELQRFESVPAGDGLVLFRLAGRWPHHGDAADTPATLMVHSGGDTHELDALPEPGLIGDGGARNAAFAAPEQLRSDATGFALAVGDLVFDLPVCDWQSAPKAMPARRAVRPADSRPAGSRPRRPSIRLPALPVPSVRMPSVAPAIRAALPRPRIDTDELRVMATGCALGAAGATAILVEIIP